MSSRNFSNQSLFIPEVSQCSLFDDLKEEKQVLKISHLIRTNSKKQYFTSSSKNKTGFFKIQSRRYLGNKYKLLNFISDIVNEKCNAYKSICDIFAGTGVVGHHFNDKNIKVISNDRLESNYVSNSCFLASTDINQEEIVQKFEYLNSLIARRENYFSKHYGNSYFDLENAKKIGLIREEIEKISISEQERNILLTSLIYALDKVANTVGHYDAYRKKMDNYKPLNLLIPFIDFRKNINNNVYCEDANVLIRKIDCDILYLDPPYNSRQYCDSYHLLENLVTWKKPKVFGKAKKMDRNHLKSHYCLKTALNAFRDLIENASCKHILLSYNNTGDSKDGRSNARISDDEILNVLKMRGKVEIFERNYQAFNAGKSDPNGNCERIFYCKVKNNL